MSDSLGAAARAPKLSEFFASLPAQLQAEPRLQGAAIRLDGGRINLSLGGQELCLVEGEALREGAQDLYPEVTLVLDARYAEAEARLPGAERYLDILPAPLPLPRLAEAVLRGLERRRELALLAEASREVARARSDREELLAISAAMSEEHETDKLLDMILHRLRGITYADAGSLYLVEPYDAGEGESRFLRFALVQNDSQPVNFSQKLIPLDHTSLAGYVASTASPLNLARVDMTPAELPVRHAARFDAETGYPARSMLTVPMVTPAGKVLGVVQLINRKRARETKITAKNVDAEALPFDTGDEELARSLASQAAVALENAYLHQEIKKLFEGLVKASVTAIEARDPTTSGHSLRVSKLSVALAERVNRLETGPYGQIGFNPAQLRELEYAALLHDFGKVGVREEVLVKAKKLFPWQEQLLRSRFAFAKKSYEAQILRTGIERLAQGAAPKEVFAYLEAELRRVKGQIDSLLRGVLFANEPVPPEGAGPRELADAVTQARGTLYETEGGQEEPLLTADEVIALSIPRGSLTAEERREIESHVVHTFEFLIQIPWTRELRRIPEIAGAHHERVDGRGYPKQRSGKDILPQARILAVADVFDALTAKDRPYKKAIPLTPALDILVGMARGGHLDADLVQIFIEARAFEVVRVSDQSSASLLAVPAVVRPPK